MRMRRLGRSGLAVSVVGLGCNNFGWRIGRAAVAAVVHAAVDAGITLFDTADIYGRPHGTSESLLGEALAGHRDEGTARIDLLQMHEPDPATPIEETLSALDDLVRAGKVLALGSSQFAGWQVTEAEWTARASGTSRFVGTQQKYSLIDRDAERELIPACLAAGVGLLPFFPLESGLLTGKYRRGAAAPAGTRLAIDGYSEFLQRAPWDMVEAVEAFAAERGLTMLDVAVGGLAARPCVVSVIAGATSPEQVRANAAAGGWEPSEADRAELDRLTAGAGQDRT